MYAINLILQAITTSHKLMHNQQMAWLHECRVGIVQQAFMSLTMLYKLDLHLLIDHSSSILVFLLSL